MKRRLANFVGPGNVSDSPLDLEAYSYCATDSTLKPNLVVWPEDTEQIRRIMLFANQTHTPIIIRGSGTNSADATIAEKAIILSMERMKRIKRLDLNNKTTEVETGVRIDDLNEGLAEFKLHFPFTSFIPVKTIGGLVAQNRFSKESHRLGRVEEWIEEVEFVDGTGKHYNTKKIEGVVGKEGLTGVITKVKLKVTEKQSLSFDILTSSELLELLKQARLLKRAVEVYFLEFFDKIIAQELGFDNVYLLLVAYSTLRGKNKKVPEVKKILEKINSVYPALRSKGYYYVLDPFVSLEKAYDLIEWCEKNKVRLHGHIGLGLFYAYFLKEDKGLVNTFRSFVRRINGCFGKGFGYGSTNKSFIAPVKKKELIKFKDEYDYNNILNPGKFIDYR